MQRRNLFPIDRYPPSNCLAAAIRILPHAGPRVPAQRVEINAGPIFGVYTVRFVVRENQAREPTAWYWGVENGERIVAARGSHDGE